jgi:signal peptidase II
MNKAVIVFVTIFSAVLAADQLIKYWLVTKLSAVGEFSLFSGGLTIHIYPNQGIAFGIPIYGLGLVVLLGGVVALLLALYFKYLRQDYPWSPLALGLVLGGAVGNNLIDRLRFGYVIDYMDFHYFPVFNLADAAIVMGVIILLARIVFKSETGTNGDKAIPQV